MSGVVDWMRDVNNKLASDVSLAEFEMASLSRRMGSNVLDIAEFGYAMGRYEVHVNTHPFQSPEDRRAWQEDKAMYASAIEGKRPVAMRAIASLDDIAKAYDMPTVSEIFNGASIESVGAAVAAEFPQKYANRVDRIRELQEEAEMETENEASYDDDFGLA